MSDARNSATIADPAPSFGYVFVVALVLFWLAPFAWMTVAAFRPGGAGAADMATLGPE